MRITSICWMGLISLDNLNEHLGLDPEFRKFGDSRRIFCLRSSERYHRRTQKTIPAIEYRKLQFLKIEEVLDRRIEQVRLTILPDEAVNLTSAII